AARAVAPRWRRAIPRSSPSPPIRRPPSSISPGSGATTRLPLPTSSQSRSAPRSAKLSSGSAPVIQQGGTKGLEQGAIDRVELRVVFGVPLDAERKRWRVGDPDGLDGAVFRHAFHDDPLARFENALAVERVHANRFAA